MFTPEQLALLREAAISGQSISAGLTALRKANYSQTGLYGHAFFSLSIGLERLLKLIYLLDSHIINNSYPTNDDLRKLGHDLEKLINYANEVQLRRKIEVMSDIQKSSIEMDLILFLSKFNKSTRYYNLDFITGSSNANRSRDPIAEWFDVVGGRILEKHFSDRQREKVKRNAALVESMLRPAIVMHTSECGLPLTSVAAASEQTGVNLIMQKYATFYCARVCRYLHDILCFLVNCAQRNQFYVPYLGDLFPLFNDDAHLLKRKTFTLPG